MAAVRPGGVRQVGFLETVQPDTRQSLFIAVGTKQPTLLSQQRHRTEEKLYKVQTRGSHFTILQSWSPNRAQTNQRINQFSVIIQLFPGFK